MRRPDGDDERSLSRCCCLLLETYMPSLQSMRLVEWSLLHHPAVCIELTSSAEYRSRSCNTSFPTSAVTCLRAVRWRYCKCKARRLSRVRVHLLVRCLLAFSASLPPGHRVQHHRRRGSHPCRGEEEVLRAWPMFLFLLVVVVAAVGWW